MPEKVRPGLHRHLAERFGGRAWEAVYAFFACGLALGTSGLAAHLAKRPHPAFERPMAALMAGGVLLTVVGWLLNRAAGAPMPVWVARDETGASG